MFGQIDNKDGELLEYSFHPGDPQRRDIVVLGHGVTGNKDRPFIAALAAGLAAAGLAALRFSFAGNGGSGGHFAASTISKEVEDLGAVLDALAQYRICYVGHSMGGAVGVLRASQDDRIELLVSLAGMVHTRDFASREFGDVTPNQGYMWEDPACPLSQTYIDDMDRIGSVVEHGANIDIPWLLVHGSDDDVVPIQDARDILAQTTGAAELIELEGADHVFSDAATTVMVERVVSWISDQFASQ